MINVEFKTLFDLQEAFPTEQHCIDHLEQLRWNGNVVSPFIEGSKVYNCKGNRYKCKESGKYFNVKTGTMFDNTKVKLRKWFMAIWLVTSHKKGISSLALSKDIGVTQKTAWFMLHRIRACFGIENGDDNLNNEVEVDEALIGGKNKNRHANKKISNAQGRSTKDKAGVLGMVERGGKLVVKKVDDLKAETIIPIIEQTVDRDATIYTDEYRAYRQLDNAYSHLTVNHSQGDYVTGLAHTNTIEGFWSLLKRGILGIYHSTSKHHLQVYLDEFAFRYNTRDIGESTRFNHLLANNVVRTKYHDLIAKGKDESDLIELPF